MNKLWQKIKYEVIKDKKIYLFLFIILIIGIITGSLFINILNTEDKTLVINEITNFFKQIKSNDINYTIALKNSFSSNLLYIILIWLLGISIIGIPIIVFIVFIKGFIIGFSVSSIILQYKFWGILGAITYIFPHVIINTLIILLLSCYALYFSFYLFWAIIKKRNINFKDIINKYSYLMLISIILIIITSLIEVFVSPYIIKLFLTFIKL
jgi:stage II sporulation protein M